MERHDAGQCQPRCARVPEPWCRQNNNRSRPRVSYRIAAASPARSAPHSHVPEAIHGRLCTCSPARWLPDGSPGARPCRKCRRRTRCTRVSPACPRAFWRNCHIPSNHGRPARRAAVPSPRRRKRDTPHTSCPPVCSRSSPYVMPRLCSCQKLERPPPMCKTAFSSKSPPVPRANYHALSRKAIHGANSAVVCKTYSFGRASRIRTSFNELSSLMRLSMSSRE